MLHLCIRRGAEQCRNERFTLGRVELRGEHPPGGYGDEFLRPGGATADRFQHGKLQRGIVSAKQRGDVPAREPFIGGVAEGVAAVGIQQRMTAARRLRHGLLAAVHLIQRNERRAADVWISIAQGRKRGVERADPDERVDEAVLEERVPGALAQAGEQRLYRLDLTDATQRLGSLAADGCGVFHHHSRQRGQRRSIALDAHAVRRHFTNGWIAVNQGSTHRSAQLPPCRCARAHTPPRGA